MSHRNHEAERWAIQLLEQVIMLDKRERDALPGSVVKLIKAARRKLIKLQKPRRPDQLNDWSSLFLTSDH